MGSVKQPDPLPPPVPLPPAAHPAVTGAYNGAAAGGKNKPDMIGTASTIATSPQGLTLKPETAKTTLLGG